jgi:uncharacterized protein with von Willebrand factor type A (vWA) domain
VTDHFPAGDFPAGDFPAGGGAVAAAGDQPASDVAAVTARFGAQLHDAGVPVDPGRCERFARAVTLMRPRTRAELYACGLATLVSGPDQIEIYDRLFAAAFGISLEQSVPVSAAVPVGEPGPRDGSPPSATSSAPPPGRAGAALDARSGEPGDEPDPQDAEMPWRALSSDAERLAGRDFADLSTAELLQLEALMRQRALATPSRRTRRYRPAAAGSRPDLRMTLRQARRTAGEPVQLARRAPRLRPRRLVVLCDISGSMEPYARAMLQLLYCASQGQAGRRAPGRGATGRARAEVFTFATRLTRITAELAAARPETVLARAGAAAPDWSGGTRIGASLKEFNDEFGCPGLARGAVVLIISDGWETGDAAQLGRQMARLSRVAYRIVWANPRTKSPRYRPEVSGMAAAWPYCDAVVSAHSLNAIDDLITALATSA